MADGRERDIDLPLDAFAGIPLGFAMTHDAQAGWLCQRKSRERREHWEHWEH
jgi:hypothetical protein